MQAEQLDFDEDSELSLDWFNGRRTPDANAGSKPASQESIWARSAPEIFRSLAEATCFGAKAIVDRFTEEGIPIKGLIGIGGVANKIRIHHADDGRYTESADKSQAGLHKHAAMGAAMFAATAAGVYAKVEDAMVSDGKGF